MAKKTANEMMEIFYRKGLYEKKQILASKEQSLKKEFKALVDNSEDQFALFEQQRVVAFYRRVPSYSVDNAGLKEHLYNLGLLPLVATFSPKQTSADVKEQIKDFAKIVGSIGVHPNKRGQVQIPSMNFSGFAPEQLSGEFYSTSQEHSVLKKKYEQLKKTILTCDELLDRKKISHEFGSISYSEKIDSYDRNMILNHLGMDFLLEHSKVDFTKLNELALQGRINKSEIESFRRVNDVRVDFIVQTLDSQEKMNQYMINRREYLRTHR